MSDNAQGIAQICEEEFASPEGQETLAMLDAVGNTTKAITKGTAIASAVIAAVSLFGSYIETTGLLGEGLDIGNPIVFIGMLVGGALWWLPSPSSSASESLNSPWDQRLNP
jgi:K(+)-stimulated pyrophosphate-energized sodium pump